MRWESHGVVSILALLPVLSAHPWFIDGCGDAAHPKTRRGPHPGPTTDEHMDISISLVPRSPAEHPEQLPQGVYRAGRNGIVHVNCGLGRRCEFIMTVSDGLLHAADVETFSTCHAQRGTTRGQLVQHKFAWAAPTLGSSVTFEITAATATHGKFLHVKTTLVRAEDPPAPPPPTRPIPAIPSPPTVPIPAALPSPAMPIPSAPPSPAVPIRSAPPAITAPAPIPDMAASFPPVTATPIAGVPSHVSATSPASSADGPGNRSSSRGESTEVVDASPPAMAEPDMFFDMGMAPPSQFSLPDFAGDEFELRARHALLKMHGLCACLAFGLFFPLAAAVARFRRLASKTASCLPTWITAHTYLVIFALTLSLLALMLVEVYKFAGDGDHVATQHAKWGAVAMFIAGAQSCSGWLRPKAGAVPSTARVRWLCGHRTAGAATIIAGIGASFTGLVHESVSLPLVYFRLFIVWVVLAVAGWLAAEVWARRKGQREAVAQLTKSPTYVPSDANGAGEQNDTEIPTRDVC